jgi:predicted DNA-binding protein (MmcQ/YjbR family)
MTNVEEIRAFCIQKKGVTESFPFDNDTLVFKVLDKMFLLMSLEKQPVSFNVKCEPEKAIQLRERYPESVLPGYHMNKLHWNTVIINHNLSANLIKSFIDDSYQLVLKSLPKAKQLSL